MEVILFGIILCHKGRELFNFESLRNSGNLGQVKISEMIFFKRWPLNNCGLTLTEPW